MTDPNLYIGKRHSLIIEDEKGRREYILKAASYSLGRSPRCQIQVQSRFVSRYHATLERCVNHQGDSFYRIIDGDGKERLSANGFLINGRKVSSHNLRHGDEIVFGPQVFAIYEYNNIKDEVTYTEGNMLDITLLDPAMIEVSDDEEHTTGIF